MISIIFPLSFPVNTNFWSIVEAPAFLIPITTVSGSIKKVFDTVSTSFGNVAENKALQIFWFVQFDKIVSICSINRVSFLKNSSASSNIKNSML